MAYSSGCAGLHLYLGYIWFETRSDLRLYRPTGFVFDVSCLRSTFYVKSAVVTRENIITYSAEIKNKWKFNSAPSMNVPSIRRDLKI
jgi:hypothetical protein